MSKHTKGPWNIAQESVDSEWYIVTAAGGRVMANVHVETGNRMDEANIKLIAAAPDLLKALMKIEREATAIAATCPPAPHACPACEILFVAREAIAKAEGGDA